MTKRQLIEAVLDGASEDTLEEKIARLCEKSKHQSCRVYMGRARLRDGRSKDIYVDLFDGSVWFPAAGGLTRIYSVDEDGGRRAQVNIWLCLYYGDCEEAARKLRGFVNRGY